MQFVQSAAYRASARAYVELIGRAGVPMNDVRNHALAIAAGLPGEVDTALRSLLAELPAGTGRVQ